MQETVVVTGRGSGIGAEIATAIARSGHFDYSGLRPFAFKTAGLARAEVCLESAPARGAGETGTSHPLPHPVFCSLRSPFTHAAARSHRKSGIFRGCPLPRAPSSSTTSITISYH